MPKIKIGDIFEINTEKGTAYFQCVNIDNEGSFLIKVFNKLYLSRPFSNIDITKTTDYYFIGFALEAAMKKKLVEKTGNVSLPSDFTLPSYARSKFVVNGDFQGWHIINVTSLQRQLVRNLSEEQKFLSPWGTWNDTLLKSRLEDGWNLDSWD